MHVLFFTYDVPFPPNSGGKTRSLNLLKHAGEGVTYSLFSFTRPGFDLSHIDELRRLGIKTTELFPRRPLKHAKNLSALFSHKNSIFSSLYFDHEVEKTLHSFIKEKNVDIVHFESFYTGFYISPDISKMGVKQVFGTENIEYKLYEEMLQHMNPIVKPFVKREVEKVLLEEIEMAKKADVTLSVTKKEADYFEQISGKKSIVIANGIAMSDFPKVAPKKHTAQRLLFIGNFSYFPNVDGLKHFYREIFVKLGEGYELIVVGRGVSKFDFLRNPAIQTIEYIPDVYDAYAMTDIFVSPIRIGGGTNFKVLEAMAAGLPVVAYKEKTIDMGFVNGRDILQVETAGEFIDALWKLKDESEREKIGTHAREKVAKLYEWKEIGKELNTVWKNLI